MTSRGKSVRFVIAVRRGILSTVRCPKSNVAVTSKWSPTNTGCTRSLARRLFENNGGEAPTPASLKASNTNSTIPDSSSPATVGLRVEVELTLSTTVTRNMAPLNVGTTVGAALGLAVGAVGDTVGTAMGDLVGFALGVAVGWRLGVAVVGNAVGTAEGMAVG